MKLSWSFILCLCGIHVSFALDEKILKMFHIPKPGGILDMLTKPKLPGTGFQLGSHFGTNAGAGSFGFGFGIGGQFGHSAGTGNTGLNIPPKEKVPVKPDVTWEDEKDKVGPRPNWEEEKVPKHDTYEEANQSDWEKIGEPDEDLSEHFMNGQLVGDGLIHPRLNRIRSKRFIESKIYHVPLLFRSNAKPFQVKIHSNPNSLLEENSKI